MQKIYSKYSTITEHVPKNAKMQVMIDADQSVYRGLRQDDTPQAVYSSHGRYT